MGMEQQSRSQLASSAHLLILFCETPTHFGAGRGVAPADLIIQRSRRTGLPIGQAPSIRGMFRSALELSGKKQLVSILFGAKPEEIGGRSGVLTFLDAKLLLLPVNSVRGMWCWTTSPSALIELDRTLVALGLSECDQLKELHELLIKLPIVEDGKAFVPCDNEVVIDNKLILLAGEVELEVEGPIKEKSTKEPAKDLIGELASKLGELLPKGPPYDYVRRKLAKRFALIGDNTFKLLTKMGIELRTRIRLEYGRKIVKEGGLWTEEYLPEMSVMFSGLLLRSRKAKPQAELGYLREFLEFISDERRFFAAGKESVGGGLVYIKLLPGVSNERNGEG